MPIKFLNPVQEAQIEPARMAPRLKKLDGIALGLLNNGKTNAAKLLSLIAQKMEIQYGVTTIISEAKGSAGNNCPPDIVNHLVEKCDAVITGIGD